MRQNKLERLSPTNMRYVGKEMIFNVTREKQSSFLESQTFLDKVTYKCSTFQYGLKIHLMFHLPRAQTSLFYLSIIDEQKCYKIGNGS